MTESGQILEGHQAAVVPDLDIVIVNWNSGPLLAQCLESVSATARDGFHLSNVIVVDNASTDESGDVSVPDGLPLRLIHNEVNAGFARACNQGALGSQAKYLLFLNPDIRLFADSLAGPIHFMESPEAQDVAICGVRLVGDGGRSMPACARFPSLRSFFGTITRLSGVLPRWFPPHLLNERECRVSRDVDQIVGAFFLIRGGVFRELAGFDERFFVYYEELDLSLRANALGFRSRYLADFAAYHKGEASTGQVRGDRLYYSLRSRHEYGFKHLGPISASQLLLLTLTVEFAARLVLSLHPGSGISAQDIVRAYQRFVGDLIPARVKAPFRNVFGGLS